MDKSYLNLNMRVVKRRNIRAARFFRLEFREDKPERATHTAEKIDYVYKVDFATGGPDALERARAEFAGMSTPQERRLAERNMLTYTKRFPELVAHSEEDFAATPDDPYARWRLVDALMLNGEVDRAVALCDEALAKKPAEGVTEIAASVRHFGRVMLRAGQRDRLLELRPDLPGALFDFALSLKFNRRAKPIADVLCINLDRDAERLKRARTMLSPGLNFMRTPGVSGSTVPESLPARAGMAVTVERKAQVGCHLGHIGAWEKVAARTDDGTYVLITEDDAQFLMGPPYGLREAMAAAARDDLDIFFVNWEPGRFLPRAKGPGDVRAYSVDETLARAGDNRFPGWGGEGYLITPPAARKMIDIAYRIGIVAPLDWQIALYAMEEIDPAKLTGARYGDAPERLAAARAEDPDGFRIKGGVSNLPLLIQSDFGYTAHNYEVGLS